MSTSVYLVAIEDSADALGAEVMRELVRARPDLQLAGVGGREMRTLGACADIDVSGLAILGLLDGIRALGRIKRTVREIAADIEQKQPDAVVLIDSWGFMWRLAKELKQRGFAGRVVKLVGPQVWATRPGRARVLARWCDHLLCIHAFEEPYYEGTGLRVTVVGNPAIGRQALGSKERFRREYDVADDAIVVGLLLGSRRAELRRVAPVLVEAAEALVARVPGLAVVCLPAPSMRSEVTAMAAGWDFEHTIVEADGAAADAMAAMDVALACSGTVTTELAEQGAAVITGYRLGWLSSLIVRRFLMRTKYISLINVAADRRVIPEFIQNDLNASAVLGAALQLISDPEARRRQVVDQNSALQILAYDEAGTAASRSAEAILWEIDQPR